MKGYRTLAFGFATILLGLLGKHVDPNLVNEYLDVIFAVIGLGVVGLRLVTSTPFGRKVEVEVGFSSAERLDLSNLTASLDPASTATLNSAFGDLNAAVTKLTSHPLLQPEAVTAFSQLAQMLPTLAASTTQVQPAAAPERPPVAQQPKAIISDQAVQAAAQQQ